VPRSRSRSWRTRFSRFRPSRRRSTSRWRSYQAEGWLEPAEDDAVRTLVLSDTHFGAWTGEPLLQHDWARRRIGDALEDVDELVLLGDLFDFLFSSVENAFAEADGFFSLL